MGAGKEVAEPCGLVLTVNPADGELTDSRPILQDNGEGDRFPFRAPSQCLLKERDALYGRCGQWMPEALGQSMIRAQDASQFNAMGASRLCLSFRLGSNEHKANGS